MIKSTLLLCCCAAAAVTFVQAREIEATQEWQLLGDNDTIAAGMHVRMDMTTGEKWVKLPDEQDTSAVATIDAETGMVETSQTSDKPSYDYDMMHRTLSKLPQEEQDRFGGLPRKETMSPEARKIFEERLAAIWKQRQQELLELETIDLPEVLKMRIRDIRDYLQDPIKDLVEVLEDLEYHLSDIDMARDFHTLGGWPLLVSLLRDDAHAVNATNVTNKLRIQRYAAWAIGTMVKNTGEFASYAVESVGQHNAMDLTMALLRQSNNDNDEQLRLREKAMYALGSMLRGNRLAQLQFCNANTHDMHELLASTSDHPKLMQRLLALAGDIVSDVAWDQEVEGLSAQQKQSQDSLITQCFASREWCDFAHRMMTMPQAPTSTPFVVTALQTTKALAPYCWKEDKFAKKQTLLDGILNIRARWGADTGAFDDEYLEELNGIADGAVAALQ